MIGTDPVMVLNRAKDLWRLLADLGLSFKKNTQKVLSGT